MIKCGDKDLKCPHYKKGNCVAIQDPCPKDKIKSAVEGEMNYLEEVLNDRLSEIVNRVAPEIEHIEGMVIAREVFFKG